MYGKPERDRPGRSQLSMALRAALREDPDIILVGEMRDFETMKQQLLPLKQDTLL